MSKQKMININSTSLQNEFRKRHLSLAEGSQRMGRCDAYLYQCVTRGSVTPSCMKALEVYFNINEEDITYPKPELVEVVDTAIDYERLYKVVFYAVKNAMKEALNES